VTTPATLQPEPWILPELPDRGQARLLATELGIPVLVAEILCLRGYAGAEDARRFLEPRLGTLGDPFALGGMEATVDRLLLAVDRREEILLFGDYDVDGVTSSVLLYHVLKALGAEVHCHIPHRTEEGYGLTPEGLECCLGRYTPRLLVALDCGTSSLEEVRTLNSKGIDVLIIDHHEPAGALPECVALVNPKIHGAFQYLCTVGLCFKVAHGLLKKRRTEAIDLRDTLDLVALGTVADLVPLVGDNRVLVHKGLAQFEHTRWAGLKALLEITGVTHPANTTDIGFKLAPRINAAGRLGAAYESFTLLTASAGTEVFERLQSLEKQNNQRKLVVEEVFQLAEAQLLASVHGAESCSIVVGGRGWHPGVIGIVASKFVQKYHRPTIVIGFDENGVGKGSGRSVAGFRLVEALRGCAAHLLKCGGHEMAAGLALREEEFEAFREAFERSAAASGQVRGPRTRVVAPELEVELSALQLELLDAYEKLGPFGMENPIPLLVARGVEPAGQPRLLKEKHMQFQLRQGRSTVKAIWFNAPGPLPPAPWDVAFELARNVYQGKVSLQLQLKHLRTSPERGAGCN
jgi:single-stranded-DNA-specific exonuclease